MSMKEIIIKICMPEAKREDLFDDQPKPTVPIMKKRSLEEKVKDAIECVESGENSAMEWEFLVRVNNDLMKKRRESKISKRAQNILDMIRPILVELGNTSGDKIDLDAEDSFKGKKKGY